MYFDHVSLLCFKGCSTQKSSCLQPWQRGKDLWCWLLLSFSNLSSLSVPMPDNFCLLAISLIVGEFSNLSKTQENHCCMCCLNWHSWCIYICSVFDGLIYHNVYSLLNGEFLYGCCSNWCCVITKSGIVVFSTNPMMCRNRCHESKNHISIHGFCALGIVPKITVWLKFGQSAFVPTKPSRVTT